MAKFIDFTVKDSNNDVRVICKGTFGDEGNVYFGSFQLFRLSNHFSTCIKSFTQDGQKDIIMELEQPKSVINALLNYSVGMETAINAGNIHNMLEICDKYSILSLRCDCVRFMLNNIQTLDPVLIINLSTKYSLEWVRSSFYTYSATANNGSLAEKIIASPRFPQLNMLAIPIWSWEDILKICIALGKVNKKGILTFRIDIMLDKYAEQFKHEVQRNLDALLYETVMMYDNDWLNNKINKYFAEKYIKQHLV